MDLKPNNELQKNYGFLPTPFPALQALSRGWGLEGGGGEVRTETRSAERTGASSLAKQRLQLASAAANRPLPRPPPLTPITK